jgi:hypothetical protein
MTIKNKHRQNAPAILLRLGLAFVFGYAAISALRTPDAWISFIPEFSTKYIPAKTSLVIISIMQLGLAAWLLWGHYIKYVAVICGLFLSGIVLSDPGTFLITFRDVPLVFACAALYFLDGQSPKPRKK